MKMIGFLAFLFIGMTLINRVMGGGFTSGAEIETMNNLLIFREISVFNIFTLPVPNMSFITEGIPRLAMWDYSFFGGNAAIIQYFFYSLSAALSFMLFAMVIGLVYQYFGRA